MSALSINPPYPLFPDIDGQPLENGFVWIGAVNLDPQSNPIAVYWDTALTIPAVQPIRTLAGYPANSGTPARLYVNSDYSIRIMNKNGSTVYSAPAATERYNGAVISSINASEVIYDPAGVGAVPTNVQAKLRESVSVFDFMTAAEVYAVQNNDYTGGVTDVTAAVQAAVNRAKTIGFVLYCPAGYYKVASAISIASAGSPIRLHGDGYTQTVFVASAAMAAVFEFDDSVSSSRNEFAHFCINGAGLALRGIKGLKVAHTLFNRLWVLETTTHAFDIAEGWDNDFISVEASYNSGDGFALYNGGLANNANTFTGCKAFLNDGFGWAIGDSSAISMQGCTIELNKRGGIFLRSNINGISIDGCYFEGNGAVGNVFTTPSITVKADIIINGTGSFTTMAFASPCQGISVTNCHTLTYAGTTAFIYAAGADGLTVQGNHLNTAFNPSTALIRSYGSTTVSPTYSLLQDVEVGFNPGFTSRIEFDNTTAGAIFYRGASVVDISADSSNLAEIDLNMWILVTLSNGTWKRADATVDGWAIPVWEIEYLVAGSTAMFGFTVNAANYPNNIGKLFAFTAYTKVGGTDSGAVLWANSIASISSADTSTNWQLKSVVFKWPVSGTISFGLRRVGGVSNALIAAPRLMELGANVEIAKLAFQSQQGSYPVRVFRGNGAPTVGTWSRGDIVNAILPTAGATPGHVCTASGTPGTWKAMANLAA